MSDSKRKDIVDAFNTVLAASTGINHVSNELETWWEWSDSKYPGVIVLDGTAKVNRAYFPSTTSAADMEADMEVIVRGYVKDSNNTTLTKRTNLLRDIEHSVENSTAIRALVLDIFPATVRADRGVGDNYAWGEVTFSVKYQYNHATP